MGSNDSVPFFIHAPGVSKDGKRCQQAVTLTDIYPTLCELAKIPIPDQCDGKSLVKHLKDPNLISEKTLTSSILGRKRLSRRQR